MTLGEKAILTISRYVGLILYILSCWPSITSGVWWSRISDLLYSDYGYGKKGFPGLIPPNSGLVLYVVHFDLPFFWKDDNCWYDLIARLNWRIFLGNLFSMLMMMFVEALDKILAFSDCENSLFGACRSYWLGIEQTSESHLHMSPRTIWFFFRWYFLYLIESVVTSLRLDQHVQL